MRIALVDSTPKAKVYPLALLKIGAWKKSQGHKCDIFFDALPHENEYDEIWVTTLFTFHINHAAGLVKEATKRAGTVFVGGVSATLLPDRFERLGVPVHVGLIPEAEKHHPDYSLLPFDPEYSIVHTSRGCIRRCGFCMVPRLEPKFVNRMDWEKDIHPKTKKILFFDNNWLAKKRADLKNDVQKIKDLVKQGKIRTVDFNQGIDARLINDEKADLLSEIPIDPIRFAFDGMQEDGYYQKAVGMMVERGFRNFMAYVLYNFEDTPKDFYYRLKESVLLAKKHQCSVGSFPMRYQPILQADAGRSFVGKGWTEQQKKGFMKTLSQQSIGGAVTHSKESDFEYWFGKDADEFARLLSYKKLGELNKKKKGALRLNRARKGVGSCPTP